MGLRFPFWRTGSDVPGLAAPTETTRRGPRVALALGAGAARGWAQIGVLQELRHYGLRPDIVVGTSMGAVVGGCYCAGRLDDLESFARSLTKRRVFGLMDFTISGLGLLAGGRLKAALRRDLGAVAIEDLPVRFAAVATQIQTGHEIWLSRGDLVDAMRASYALPGVFEPVQLDGRWLIDGALVNPVPVSVCRALGADIVVAVNLVAETLARAEATPALVAAAAEADQIGEARSPLAARSVFEAGTTAARLAGGFEQARPTIAQVLVDAFNITQDRISRSRLAGDPPDLTVNAKVGGVGLFEFHRAAELIAIGRDAAQKALPELSQLLA
jgi:NTE family protein